MAKYKLQIASADDTERPDDILNDEVGSWETLFESDDVDDLLLEMCCRLNDEIYPTNEWLRIVKDDVILQTGEKLKEGKK